MKVVLKEPAEAKNGGAYAGWANAGDELFFPHVDSCCAVLVFGDKAVVGGHMGAQWPGEAAANYPNAGRKVWELVAANHRRLNSQDEGCRVVTIGHHNWYHHEVPSTIWGALKPVGTLALKITERCPKGVDITATLTKIIVQACESNSLWEYDVPGEFEYIGPDEIK